MYVGHWRVYSLSLICQPDIRGHEAPHHHHHHWRAICKNCVCVCVCVCDGGGGGDGRGGGGGICNGNGWLLAIWNKLKTHKGLQRTLIVISQQERILFLICLFIFCTIKQRKQICIRFKLLYVSVLSKFGYCLILEMCQQKVLNFEPFLALILF